MASHQLFSPDGTLSDPVGLNGAAKVLLDQLLWLGSVLRDARPYTTD